MTLFGLAALVCFAGHATAGSGAVTIVLLGDSYLNGAGSRGSLTKAEEFSAILSSALAADGVPATLTGPGFKELSESGANWIKRAPAAAKMMAAPSNYVVMLELGANDCGEQLKVDETRANLDLILTRLNESHIPVLVIGTSAYEICRLTMGATYPADYTQMFADLAERYGEFYYSDFKDGVSGHPELLQADQDHPNAAGNALIAEKMLPVVKELVARAQK